MIHSTFDRYSVFSYYGYSDENKNNFIISFLGGSFYLNFCVRIKKQTYGTNSAR